MSNNYFYENVYDCNKNVWNVPSEQTVIQVIKIRKSEHINIIIKA